MAVSDPVADFLTRIRNSVKAKHRFVDIGWSKMKETLAQILKNQGFIEYFRVQFDEKKRGTIRIYLKYTSGRSPVIQGLTRISKPGLRKYVGHQDISGFYGNMGLSIVTTSKGVMSGNEAKKQGIGGELLCKIW